MAGKPENTRAEAQFGQEPGQKPAESIPKMAGKPGNTRAEAACGQGVPGTAPKAQEKPGNTGGGKDPREGYCRRMVAACLQLMEEVWGDGTHMPAPRQLEDMLLAAVVMRSHLEGLIGARKEQEGQE